MIHFFPTFSPDAANSPYGEALRRSGVPHRIIALGVRTHYRNSLGFLFGVIPSFTIAALRSAIASLSPGRPAPDTVVLGSDIAVLVFALARLLFHRRAVRIVLSSFIYTHRGKPREDALRQAYFRFVLGHTDLVVVHSRLEVERYSRIFAPSRTRFVFIPWATHITNRDAFLAEERAGPESRTVLTAGRSGRDYGTLFAAMANVDAELRVICDLANAVPDDYPKVRTTILTKCHSWEYLREVLQATIVVIPLAVEDISAGQMVLIQAMGLGTAIVVTDTPTIRDYVTADHDVLLVPRGDVIALRTAILRLLEDAALRGRLAGNAQATFDANCTTNEHMQRLLTAIASLMNT